MPTTDEILRKYGAQIESEINTQSSSQAQNFSQEYLQFKQDMLPEISRYRRWCHTLGNLININLSQKEKAKVERALNIAHLEVTPSQAVTLAVFSFMAVFLAVSLTTLSVYLINGSFNFLFFMLGIMASIFVFYYTYTMPQRLANSWRLKASSQMVPAILYIVVYMKHTSNLEKAIEFASQHLEVPLALDFKKIFWDVEVGKFSTIKQSLDSYLETWQDYAPEFIESVHLIESSLYEPSDVRRIQTLEKSLQIILDGVYEKMLKYSREIRSPLTNIYMLGIILPTLGLALLPLASTLLGGIISWQHVFIIFNIIIPFFVFYMASEVLLKRPGGYGDSSVLEQNPDYPKFASKKPWIIASIICLPLLIIGLSPFILQIPELAPLLNLQKDYNSEDLGLPWSFKLFDFKKVGDSQVGPFSPFAAIISLLIPLSVALFFSISYGRKTKALIKARQETTELEKEFTNSLFQLGNRIGDGIPAEIALARVANSTQGQKTQKFFTIASQNIQQLGMSVEEAIFNKKRGAIIFFPSALIATSMRILVESVKKGLEVAARSLMSISEYVKNIQKIDERLRDLLAEIISDMKSNMTFLAPLLAGIIVGLSTMITSILNKIKDLTVSQAVGDTSGLSSILNIANLFDVSAMIPPYFIQVSVGLYIVEIIFILTITLVTINSGKDPLQEKYELAKNLKRGIYLYTITALIAILALSILSAVALPNLT